MSISGQTDIDGETELSPAHKTNVEDGDGGETMSIWTQDRQTLVDELASATFTNQSSFDIPNAVADASDMSNSWTNGESLTGVSVVGTILDDKGEPMTGTAQLKDGGGVRDKQTFTGKVAFTGQPPAGVSSGDNQGTGSLDFAFVPSVAGIAVEKDDVSLRTDLGKIEYGAISGTVIDYEGNPVPNEAVYGLGAGDTTGGDGQFNLLAPGGTSATFTTLSGTWDFDESIVAGQTNTLEFQYPKLTIEVLDADFEPVEDAPVKVGESTYKTDESGRVEFPTAPIGNYDVSVMDYFKASDLSVSQPGTEYVYSVGPSSSSGEWEPDPSGIGGLKIKAIDDGTGERIRGVVAQDVATGARSESAQDGICKLLSTDLGDEIEVEIGTGDERYVPTTITGSPPENEMVEVTVPLEPKTQVVNY